MWKVVFISSGITAYITSSKAYALQWLEDNNTDENGESLGLFMLQRMKHTEQDAQKAQEGL